MAAYVIADIDVTDPQGYEGYKTSVSATIAAFGGRYLTRAGKTEVLEGNWSPKRVVILEFPNMAKLKEWYASPGYQPLRELRQRYASSNLIIIEGV